MRNSIPISYFAFNNQIIKMMYYHNNMKAGITNRLFLHKTTKGEGKIKI